MKVSGCVKGEGDCDGDEDSGAGDNDNDDGGSRYPAYGSPDVGGLLQVLPRQDDEPVYAALREHPRHRGALPQELHVDGRVHVRVHVDAAGQRAPLRHRQPRQRSLHRGGRHREHAKLKGGRPLAAYYR